MARVETRGAITNTKKIIWTRTTVIHEEEDEDSVKSLSMNEHLSALKLGFGSHELRKPTEMVAHPVPFSTFHAPDMPSAGTEEAVVIPTTMMVPSRLHEQLLKRNQGESSNWRRDSRRVH